MVPSPQRYADDESAVRAVRAGDVDAFERLVVRWQGPLVNLAYRYCRDRGMAEEMAQEAFLKAYRGLNRWQGDGKFSTWLFAIAHNHYRSVLRRHVPEGISLEEARATLAAGDRRDETDAAMRADAVHTAVAALPPRYRDVVVLYYFQERDVAETARIADLPEGTVKVRLHRARKLLEAKLEGLIAAAGHAARETA